MLPLFLIFFGIYAAMNAYLFWKVFFVFPQLGHLRYVLGAFLALMVAGPVLGHYLEKWHTLLTARIFSYVVYSWAVIILWFAVLMFAVDVWNLGVRLAVLGWPAARAAFLPGRLYLPSIGVMVGALLVMGLYEAQNVTVHRLNIQVPNLTGDRPIKMMQISDLHMGEHMNPARMDRIIELIRQEKPDVLISTGDLVDTSLENLRREAGLFADIHPPLGKFAVLGNHEFYNGLDKSLAFHEAAGFRMLRAQSVTLDGRIRLAGVDDPAGRWRGGQSFTDESAALATAGPDLPTVLLKHQPRVDEKSLGHFVLQLSGHTHGGQVLPFHLVTRTVYRFYRGLYDLPGGAHLYVSPGAGTWGPPIRLAAQPEVTLITLSRKG